MYAMGKKVRSEPFSSLELNTVFLYNFNTFKIIVSYQNKCIFYLKLYELFIIIPYRSSVLSCKEKVRDFFIVIHSK